jgi:branched-chain amino acid transport system ATP-binding protein
VLEVRNADVFYGEIHALHGVTFDVKKGEIATIIGANGAGKTTTLRAISGLVRATPDSILFEGEPITHTKPERIVALGIAHVPQGRRIFPGLTVRENLNIATSPWKKRGMRADKELERVYTLFPILEQREKQLGWSLSGGEQQMLAVGRALMARPKLLLLDEPSLGLAPKVVEEMFDTIKVINQEGTTILIVEQNAVMALSIAQRGFVLELGRIVLNDSAAHLADNEQVRVAYLGETGTEA